MGLTGSRIFAFFFVKFRTICVCLLSLCVCRKRSLPFFYTGSSLNASWQSASTPKSGIGNINTYHTIRLNGEDVSCWARLQPLTPAPFPFLISLSLFVASSIFKCCLSCSGSSPVFHSRPFFMSCSWSLPLLTTIVAFYLFSYKSQ